MTDAEILAAIRTIVGSRPRAGAGRWRDRASAEVRDLSKYDQIVGLLQRNPPPARATAPTKNESTG